MGGMCTFESNRFQRTSFIVLVLVLYKINKIWASTHQSPVFSARDVKQSSSLDLLDSSHFNMQLYQDL